jgi:hypothetical protein
MKACLAIVALIVVALLLPGCGEKVSQNEGFGATYKNGSLSWRVVPVVIDGHKYILATSEEAGHCAICPAVQDK